MTLLYKPYEVVGDEKLGDIIAERDHWRKLCTRLLAESPADERVPIRQAKRIVELKAEVEQMKAERDKWADAHERQADAHNDSINRWNESEAKLEAEVESLKAECERVVEDQRYEMVEANAAREMAKRLAEVLSNCLNSLDYIQVNHPPQTGHGVMRDCMTSASAVLAAYREWAE